MTLEYIYQYIESQTNIYLQTKHWKFKIIFSSIVLFLISQFVLAPGSFLFLINFFKNYLFSSQEYESFVVIKERTQSLFGVFTENRFDTFSHEHKLVYRLFLPILAKISPFHTVGPFIYVIQWILGIVYLSVVTKLVYQITESKCSTFYFMLTFVSIYAGNAFLWDVTGYGDFFAYLFLFLSIYFRNSLAIFIFLTLAFWVDERAVANVFFVYAWWVFVENRKNEVSKIIYPKTLLVVFSAVFGYFIGRIVLKNLYSLPQETNYYQEFSSTVYENIKYQGFRLWSGFEGFVGMFLLTFVNLLLLKHYKETLLLIIASAASIIVAFFAHDGNRGFSYALVFLFICLLQSKHYFTKKELYYLCLSIFVISILFPMANHLRFPGGYMIM